MGIMHRARQSAAFIKIILLRIKKDYNYTILLQHKSANQEKRHARRDTYKYIKIMYPQKAFLKSVLKRVGVFYKRETKNENKN